MFKEYILCYNCESTGLHQIEVKVELNSAGVKVSPSITYPDDTISIWVTDIYGKFEEDSIIQRVIIVATENNGIINL